MNYRTAPDRRAALIAAAEETARAVGVAAEASQSAEQRVAELEREIHGHRVAIGKAAERQRELEANAKARRDPADPAHFATLEQERTAAEAALATSGETLEAARRELAAARRALAGAEHAAALAARELATLEPTKDER